MDVAVEVPVHDHGKLDRLFEASIQTFPGNCTISQLFKVGFLASGKEPTRNRINPDDVALIDEETHTFQQLDTKSDKLAEAIRAIVGDNYETTNPDQDTVIGVCIAPSDKLVLMLFAIEKLGAAYLPFEISFPEERVVKIVKDARPILIISDPHSNVLSKFDAVKDTAIVVTTTDLLKLAEGIELSEQPIMFPSALEGAERTAIVLYTSGSSGEPKGVRLSHRNIMNRLHWQWQTFPFEKNDRCIFKTSLTFVDSVAEIFGPLLQGYSLTILPKQFTTNPNVFIQKLGQYKITRLVLVPSLLKAMFQTVKLVEGSLDLLKSINMWVCSGETITKDLVMEFFEHFPRGHTLCNFYGSTEIMGDVTYVAFKSRQDAYLKTTENAIPIGEPINNTVIYVLSDRLELSPPGELGSIYVGGYNLATGYVGMKEHPSFIPNPFCKTPGFNRLYKTGDYGRIGETTGKFRTLLYEGRVDSQIKVRGQRVDLSEIEMVISEIELVSKVKVLCYNPGKENQAIIAFIVPASNVHIDRIKALVEIRLRDYERPTLRPVEDIPLLVNGKTDRQRLLKLHEQDLHNRSAFVQWGSLKLPENKIDTAKIVLTTMSEITGTSVEDIAENLQNSFYNVGGSSLNSIQCIVKLRERKCFITIPEFVGAKTIREIIEHTTMVLEGEREGGGKEEKEQALSVLPVGEKIYNTNYLSEIDKSDVCKMIAHSFSRHGDLEEYTSARYDEFITMIESIWEPLVEKELSFIIRRKKGSMPVGVALNFDVYDEPSEIETGPRIGYVLGLLEFIESRQREKLPKGKGKLVHSFMMGTSEEIDEAENVFVIQYMEEKVIQMAKEKGYLGIMTTNTSAITQQIGQDIHGYETLSEYQVNAYVAPDNTKPFALAPDSYKIVCCWKRIGSDYLNVEDLFFHKSYIAESLEDDKEQLDNNESTADLIDDDDEINGDKINGDKNDGDE